jgi:hypothetical protein
MNSNDIAGGAMGVKGLGALSKLVLTGATAAERNGFLAGFFTADLLETGGSGVCTAGCVLSFYYLLRDSNDIAGGAMGVRGVGVLLTFVLW